MRRTSVNLMIFISLLMLFTSGVYYIFSLALIPWVVAVIFSIAAYILIKKRKILEDPGRQAIGDIKYYIPFFISIIAFLVSLAFSATDEALISPWQVVPAYSWLIFAISVIALFWAEKKNKGEGWISDISLMIFYAAFLSIAVIVYKIGYGFDPFIHEAAMRYIERFGAILPKTPYYIGQYGLEITLDRLLPLSLTAINKILVPLVASISLAPAFRYLMEKIGANKKASFLATISILPFFAFLFIATTPQNLAFIFLLLAVLYALSGHTRVSFLISLAALSIHPISGIPALAACYIIYLHQKNDAHKIILSLSVISGAALIIIMSFILSGAKFAWMGIDGLSSLASFKWPFPNQENALLDTLYFFIDNFWILAIALPVIGIIKAVKRKSFPALAVLSAALASFIPAILATLFISFDSLISYEQQDYVRRLLIGSWIITLPLTAYGAYIISEKVIKAGFKNTSLIMAGIMSVALYGSYPRFDNFHNSRGYSLSNSDLEAVHIVDSMAGGDRYIALSNQQSGVGALHELGFGHYINIGSGKEIYFYSIPTGGELYQYYLSMVYDGPTRDTMDKAMDDAGVDKAYLLVSRYWWASDKIIAEAKLEADRYEQTSDKEISIFEFDRND